MATSTKTPNSTEEQDAAYNPGDAYYEDQFNQIARHEELADLEAGYAAPAYEGRSTSHIDSHGDEVQNNEKADTPEPDENITATKSKEKSGGAPASQVTEETGGGRDKFVGNLRGKGGKNKGPTAGVSGFLAMTLVTVISASFGLAGSLLINVKEIFFSDRADSTGFNRIMSRAAFSNKFNNKDGCSSKIAIKCAASSISRSDMKRYQDQGIKMTGAEVKADGTETGNRVENGDTSKLDSDTTTRVSLEKVKFPDGTESTSGKDFWEHVDTNIDARRWAERASPSKASFYLNKFFSEKILGNKFDSSKGKKAFPDGEGTDGRNAQHAAFNDQTGGLSEEDVRNGGLDSDVRRLQEDVLDRTTRAGGKAARGGAAGEIIQGYCAAYQAAYIAKALVKAYHMVKLVKFGLLFFQAADEIKRGVADGPKTAYLSDNFTYYNDDPESEEYNLSATDSEGYKIAAYGDKAGLKEFSEKYILGGTLGKGLNALTSGLASPVVNTADVANLLGEGTDHQKMKRFCRAVQGDAAMVATACIGLIPVIGALTAGTAGLGAIPGIALNVTACECTVNAVNDIDNLSIVDTIRGGPTTWISKLSNIGCNALEAGLRYVADKIIEKVLTDSVKEKIAEVLRELNIGSDTKGVDAGNAVAAGAQMMLSTSSMGYGLRPSKSDNKNKDVTDYIAAAQPLQEKYTELAKADARETPFDANNEYSFMGTIVRSLNLGSTAPTSLFGNITTLSTIIPTALKTAVTGEKVNALYSQPSTAANGDSGRYDHCEDPDLEDLNDGKGVTGDTYCSIISVVTTDEMTKASDQAYKPDSKQLDEQLDWMLASQSAVEGNDTNSGTFDNGGNCANLDGSDDPECKNSKLASIDTGGKPIQDSQYSKYLKYCTDQREVPIGSQVEPYEQGSERDQKWYSGDQCTADSYMMKNFRMWTNYCLQLGTSDGSPNCYEKAETTPTNSTCGDGTTASIYTCALKFDNYRYDWGGGHGDIASLVNKFNAGEYPQWTPLVDCSGLIRAAVYDSFGVETDGGATPSVYRNNPHWEEISKEEAKQGDIVSLGSNDNEGHVVIVESNDPGTKQWKIFHASTSGGAQEDNILHGTLDYAGDGRPVDGVYRFKK